MMLLVLGDLLVWVDDKQQLIQEYQSIISQNISLSRQLFWQLRGSRLVHATLLAALSCAQWYANTVQLRHLFVKAGLGSRGNTVQLRHLFVKACRGSRGRRAAGEEINNSPLTLSSPAPPASPASPAYYLNGIEWYAEYFREHLHD